MNLNDFFERCYCLNLAARHDRFQHCFRVFNHLGWSVRHRHAIDGRDWPARHGRNIMMTGPRIASNLSFACILQEAIQDRLHSVLIFEDDLLMQADIADKVQQYLKALPVDWGLAYLGWNGRQDHAKCHVNEYVNRVRQMNSTHSIGIRSFLFEEYLQRLMRLEMPQDFEAKEMQETHHCFSPAQNLVGQGGFGSDVNNPLDYLGSEVLENYL